jgi:hypothetical protein
MLTNAYGQTAPSYPDFFSSYFFNTYVINPSYISENVSFTLNSYYKFREGSFSDINTFFAGGEKIIYSDRSYTHGIRLMVFNEKEGQYISRPKAYINYAVEIPVTSDTRICSGLSAGISSANFTAPSGSGNVILPDGTAGAGLKIRKYYAGISSSQIFNSEGVAIRAPVKLQRFYNFQVEGEQQLSAFFSVKEYFLWRSLPYFRDMWNLSVLLNVKEAAGAGITYKGFQGFSFPAYLRINPSGNSLQLTFTYNSNLMTNTSAWNESFEIGLKYIVTRRKPDDRTVSSPYSRKFLQ